MMQNVGLWLGFFFSLMVFSLIVREGALSRFALHLLIGASMGYTALLAWQAVLVPFLLTPLLTDTASNRPLLLPLFFGLLLACSGLERIFRTSRPAQPLPTWRRATSIMGILPVALIVGLSIAIVTLGAILGTLAPQTLRAASTGLTLSQGLVDFLVGLLLLLLTTGALLQLRFQPDRDLANRPRWMTHLLVAWMAIGRRGLWFTAGVLFARLLASRFSLLIARFDALALQIERMDIWQWFR